MKNVFMTLINLSPKSIDYLTIEDIEGYVCTHNAGTFSKEYADHTDDRGDVGHIRHYCDRCGNLVGKDY